MLADLIRRRALAEAGDVGVALTLSLSGEDRGIGSLSSPSVVGVGDEGDVLLGQVAMGAVDQVAHLAGVDEEDCAPAVAMFAIAATPGEEPEQAGIWVERKSWPGRATTQSTRSASIRLLRILPSPDWLEDMEPLARTKPAMPRGERWCRKCWTQAKLALPLGGTPYRSACHPATARPPSRRR